MLFSYNLSTFFQLCICVHKLNVEILVSIFSEDYVFCLWDLRLAFRSNDELMLSKTRDLIFKKAERLV